MPKTGTIHIDWQTPSGELLSHDEAIDYATGYSVFYFYWYYDLGSLVKRAHPVAARDGSGTSWPTAGQIMLLSRL